MTKVFVTVDTELSLGSHQRGMAPDDNLATSVFGETGEGAFGIGWQMARLGAHGLTGVFFVDPAPAALFGVDLVRRIVDPILTAGHDVQLHIHTEWLRFLDEPPVAERRGAHIGDFDETDQLTLLGWAAELLIAAGAPEPVAFRAGNYGADDRTLRALARLGIGWDSSFNAPYLGGPCRIGLPADTLDPVRHEGVTEVPVSHIFDRPGHRRPAQLCALSDDEMAQALRHAVAARQPAFTIVSHSFELLSRDRRRANRAVVQRFDRLCALLGDLGDAAPTTGYPGLTLDAPPAPARALPPSLPRTASRMAQQALAHWRYERP